MIGESDVLISKRQVLDVICDTCDTRGLSCPANPCNRYLTVEKLQDRTPSLYGYNIEHLAMIATILHKEGLSPERVTEVITDVDRIIAMVRAEFEEQLRKTIEHLNTTMKGEQ